MERTTASHHNQPWTSEEIREVRRITVERESKAEEQMESRNHLRLVPAEPTKKHLPIEPEMKEIIEEMKRRQKDRTAVSLIDPDAAA